MGRQVWVTATVAAPPGRLWHLTQDTAHHPRWDLRFSSITPAGHDDGHQRFTYALALPHPRLPLLTVRGTGTSTAERRGDDGAGTSAIRFTAGDAPADRLSPLASGTGFWRYAPRADGHTRFTTGYDYRPGWGRLGAALDPWLTRPLVGWATAWSFDRLRLWAEKDQAPERSRDLALAWTAARVVVLVVAAALGRRRPALALAALGALALPPPSCVPSARRCSRRPDRRAGRGVQR
ncbi:MAG: SRPBCC family protein [Quadrisphaera sp.]